MHTRTPSIPQLVSNEHNAIIPPMKRTQTGGSAVSNVSEQSNNTVASKRSASSHSHSPRTILSSSTQLVANDFAAVSSSDNRKIMNMTSIQKRRQKGPSLAVADDDEKQIAVQQSKHTVLDVLSSTNAAASLEELCLKQNGYIRGNKIGDCVQGEIFEATSLNSHDETTVVIKKTDKALHLERISIQQGISMVVEDNCIKEAILLHHLTVDNKPTSDYIVKFVQFFESESAFYLVMEKAGDITLEEFCQRAHRYIEEKKLKLKDWKKFVKYIFWQIAVIVYWLHQDMKCCHLDLNLKNIMVANGQFKQNSDGTVSIDSNIQIKVVDFGLSECFQTQKHVNALSDSLESTAYAGSTPVDDEKLQEDDDDDDDDDEDEYRGNDFKCTKFGITDKHYLVAPRVFEEEPYDARASDCWNLGIILYQLATGLDPYSCADVANANYQRIRNHQLVELLTVHQRSKYVTSKQLSLMQGLLNCNEPERYSAVDVLKHEWVRLYFSKYRVLIKKKSDAQIARNQKFGSKMQKFPYYQCPN